MYYFLTRILETKTMIGFLHKVLMILLENILLLAMQYFIETNTSLSLCENSVFAVNSGTFLCFPLNGKCSWLTTTIIHV